MILSPKEKFQQSQIRTGQWAQLVANPIFDEAVDAALLQLQKNMPIQTSDPYSAGNSHHQMCGAQRFIHILKTIHETTKQEIETKAKGLNYQAGV